MAGRENQGDLWFLTSGPALQPPIVCAGFKTLSIASVQTNWELKYTFNEVSSRLRRTVK